MFTKKLFWVLVIGFLNLVSVDAKERSFNVKSCGRSCGISCGKIEENIAFEIERANLTGLSKLRQSLSKKTLKC